MAFNIACGACWFCRRGQTQLCDDSATSGAGRSAATCRRAGRAPCACPVADVNLLPVPEGVDDERALFVGDVLTTAVLRGVDRRDRRAERRSRSSGRVRSGSAACRRSARGRRERSCALDREPARLALAASAGAGAVTSTSGIRRWRWPTLTDGRGADVVIEAVGHPGAFETAVDIVRRGGRVVVVGMYAGETVELQLGVYWARALDVRFAGVCPVHAWWGRAMAEWSAAGSIRSPLISPPAAARGGAAGYELFDRREATKVVS